MEALTPIPHSPSGHSGESRKSQHFPSQPWAKPKLLGYIACPQTLLCLSVSALATGCRFLSISLPQPVPPLMKAAPPKFCLCPRKTLDLGIVCLHRKNVDWAVFDCCRELSSFSERKWRDKHCCLYICFQRDSWGRCYDTASGFAVRSSAHHSKHLSV